FEALARLNTEKLGPISPVEFIPIAEKSKLIVSIGEKINKMAFDFINRLGQEGYDSIGVYINISAIQLLSPSFSDKLFKLIDESKVNIKNVGIEITESVFASDYRNANRVLDRLRKAGIQIAIDDFGTGYSSLASEYELRVSYLKIDKYFIDKLLVTQPNKAITNEIISIAHKLGHYTIAEGVEYQSQLHYLENHNCDKVQGYLISRPLDEDQAIDFLKRYKS
ncbi:MAG: EAL domain-containing protein, partial [Caldicoprobacterales bacterium]